MWWRCQETCRKRRIVSWDNWSYWGNRLLFRLRSFVVKINDICRCVCQCDVGCKWFSLFVSGIWTKDCGMRKMPNSLRRGLVTNTLSFLLCHYLITSVKTFVPRGHSRFIQPKLSLGLVSCFISSSGQWLFMVGSYYCLVINWSCVNEIGTVWDSLRCQQCFCFPLC